MVGRIGVLGAGGMGSTFAAFLTEAGRDVVLIGRGSPHVRAVAAAGLRVTPPDSAPRAIPVAAAVHAADVPASSLDVVLVLTKTFDTTSAAAGIAHALSPGGVAVSLQNGLGNDAALSGVFGSARSLVGVTTVGATLQQPGEISISGSTSAGRSLTHIGAMGTATASHRADAVAAVLDASGLPTVHSADIAVPMWEKLALSVMSPVSAVLRMTVAEVWASADGRSLIAQMFDEVVSVAEQQGVILDRPASWAHAKQVYVGTGQHFSSMCTDVMQSRQTELASMAGAVRQLAASGGLPVPVHATVVALLRALGP